jgi:hypothetical protein
VHCVQTARRAAAQHGRPSVRCYDHAVGWRDGQRRLREADDPLAELDAWLEDYVSPSPPPPPAPAAGLLVEHPPGPQVKINLDRWFSNIASQVPRPRAALAGAPRARLAEPAPPRQTGAFRFDDAASRTEQDASLPVRCTAVVRPPKLDRERRAPA